MGRLGIDWYRLTKKRVSADGSIGIQDGGAFTAYNTYARDYNADFLVSFHKKFFDQFGINGNVGANY